MLLFFIGSGTGDSAVATVASVDGSARPAEPKGATHGQQASGQGWKVRGLVLGISIKGGVFDFISLATGLAPVESKAAAPGLAAAAAPCPGSGWNPVCPNPSLFTTLNTAACDFGRISLAGSASVDRTPAIPKAADPAGAGVSSHHAFRSRALCGCSRFAASQSCGCSPSRERRRTSKELPAPLHLTSCQDLQSLRPKPRPTCHLTMSRVSGHVYFVTKRHAWFQVWGLALKVEGWSVRAFLRLNPHATVKDGP